MINFKKDLFLNFNDIEFQILASRYFIDCWHPFVVNFGVYNFVETSIKNKPENL